MKGVTRLTTVVIEGTWEELVARSAEFSGHRFRLTRLDTPEPEELTDEEFERLMDELGEIGRNVPVDPNETYSREMIYADHD